MKKYSKLALMMALVLSMSTVMAACDDPTDPSKEIPPTQEELDNQVYKAAAAEWAKYIEYVAPNTVESLEKTTFKTKEQNRTILYNAENGYYRISDKVIVEKTFTDEEAIEPISETKRTKTTTTETYYDNQTHEELFKTVSVNVAKENDKALDSTLKPTDECRYAINTWFEYVVEVSKMVYVLKTVEEGAEPLDETLFSSYEEKTVYSYYHIPTKTWIAENLEEDATKRTNPDIAQAIVDIGNKTYLFDKATGAIVATFDLGMEYAVPSFDASNPQFILSGNTYTWNASGYGYYAQGDYEYYIKEAQPQTIPMGDIMAVLMPEVSFSVYKDGAIVAEYASDSYAVAGYAVLPNGNVYVCEYKYLDADATSYDANFGGQKIDIIHNLLNVATGAATEVNNDFLANKVYTSATEEMVTFNSYLTMGSANEALGNMKLKDGYVLAEIQKHSNGALEGATSFAVLSAETMEIVAELPKIVPNQFGYVGYLDANTMFVQAKVADSGNTVLNYTVNTQTGNLELFFHGFVDVQLIDNGFIYDGGVYDYDFNRLAIIADSNPNNYSHYGEYQIINGKVLIRLNSNAGLTNFFGDVRVGWAWASIKEVTSYNNGYFDEYKGEWVGVEYTEMKWVVEEPIYYTSESYYNASLEVIGGSVIHIQCNDVDKYFALDGTEYGFNLGTETVAKDVTYEGNSYTFHYNVVRIAEAEALENGMVIVSILETWTMDSSFVSGLDNLPEGMERPQTVITYTEAYLLK